MKSTPTGYPNPDLKRPAPKRMRYNEKEICVIAWLGPLLLLLLHRLLNNRCDVTSKKISMENERFDIGIFIYRIDSKKDLVTIYFYHQRKRNLFSQRISLVSEIIWLRCNLKRFVFGSAFLHQTYSLKRYLASSEDWLIFSLYFEFVFFSISKSRAFVNYYK